MAAKKVKKQVRVYLDPEEAGMLTDAMKTFDGWTETDVVGLIVASGLRALHGASYRFSWPLRLQVSAGVEPAADRRLSGKVRK